jgi:hypothetical protein
LNPASASGLARTAIEEDKVDIEPITSQGAAPDLAPDIACDLGEEKAATQADRWLRLAREAALGRAETADGLDLRFRDEAAVERELSGLVSVERNCCPWARWEVHRVDGELIMRATSTPEGAAALHGMFRAESPEGKQASGTPLS